MVEDAAIAEREYIGSMGRSGYDEIIRTAIKDGRVLDYDTKKEEPGALNAPRSTASPSLATSLPFTDSTISISTLLDFVNQYFPDILPEDVLKHYGYTEQPAGELGQYALYSARNKSNREILADARETTIDTSTADGEAEAT